MTKPLNPARKTCLVSIGYGFKAVVPAARLSAFMSLMEECQLVESEWTGTNSYMVERDAPIEVRMEKVAVLTRAEYDAIDQAERDEAAAAKKAAESGDE